MRLSSPILLLAAAASALTLIVAPAIAQDYYDDEIIVEAPGVVRERTGERLSIGAPLEELTLQRAISTKDLDLRYDADVYELHRRIHAVAAESCDDVDHASQGVALTTERQCVRDAMAQANALVYSARG